MRFKPQINLTFLLKTFLSIFALWFLLHNQLLTPRLILNLFAQPVVFLIITFLMLLTLALSSWRWYRLNLALGIHVTFLNTFYLTYVGLAFNNLLPGGISGDVIRLAGVVKQTMQNKSTIMLSLLVDRLMGLMGVAALMTLLVGMKMQLTHGDLHYFTVGCIVFMACGIIGIFVLPKEIGITAWFKQRYSDKRWSSLIINLLESVQAYRNNRVILMDAIITSIVIQMVIALTLYIIAHKSIFVPVSMLDNTVASMTTQIANWVPITPGGLGVGEIVFAKTLAILNQNIMLSSATIYLIYRLMNLLFSLPAVLIYMCMGNLTYQQIEEV